MRCQQLQILEILEKNELKYIHEDAFHCSNAMIVFGPPGLESVYKKE